MKSIKFQAPKTKLQTNPNTRRTRRASAAGAPALRVTEIQNSKQLTPSSYAKWHHYRKTGFVKRFAAMVVTVLVIEY
jgi:hypothetical protein